MRSILLPQAVTSMLPVLISQMVVVLKDTAIGYQITFLEMVRQGTQVGSAYGNYVPALIVIAVLMISRQLHAVLVRGVVGGPDAPISPRPGAHARHSLSHRVRSPQAAAARSEHRRRLNQGPACFVP